MSTKLTSNDLIFQLSTVIDPALARAAVESYVEMHQRYIASDWKPAELDGGRLCEAISRCVHQLDTGEITHSKLPGAIRDRLKDEKQSHRLHQKDRYHIEKVIDTVYKFRSDRGAMHISPVHTANSMDAMIVLYSGKWLFAELLRLAWNGDRNVVGEIISYLVQMEHGLIHELDGLPMVLARDISAPDEILLLLHHAPHNRLTRSDLRSQAMQKPKTVSMAISRLLQTKDIREAAGGELALTPVGQKRVMDVIIPKYAPAPH